MVVVMFFVCYINSVDDSGSGFVADNGSGVDDDIGCVVFFVFF
jgi:hypothetical protein